MNMNFDIPQTPPLPPPCMLRFSYLQKHTAEHIIDLREECWQPLIYYRASLLAVAEMDDAVSYVSSGRRHHIHGRSPASKQKLEGMTLRLSLQESGNIYFTIAGGWYNILQYNE